MSKPRLIAFYLPQFHTIKENDEWWGPGFTEWTNVAKAKPLFKGHDQPKIPRDLGFYDLRVPEVREKQAELAQRAGIEGFCYWHYWFGNGKRLLNRPFDEVVKSGKPDFPFCLGWANHSWYKKTWAQENNDKLLIEQVYPGLNDYTNHFNTMLSAFKDKRYMKKNGKLIFLIWDANGIPNIQEFFRTWNKLASEQGMNGFYFIGFTRDISTIDKLKGLGYDEVCVDLLHECYSLVSFKNELRWKLGNHKLLSPIPRIFTFDNYSELCQRFFSSCADYVIPCIMPNWDHSPRSLNRGEVMINCSPQKFCTLLRKIYNIQENKDKQEIIIFIKSWNEWGEGNYLEPDMKYETSYIDSMSNINF